jgi:hypothetical protein
VNALPKFVEMCSQNALLILLLDIGHHFRETFVKNSNFMCFLSNIAHEN